MQAQSNAAREGSALLEIRRLRKQGDVEKLITWLRELDDNDHLRLRAPIVRALGRVGDPRGVAPVISALSSPDDHVRLVAAKALRSFRRSDAIEALVSALSDDSWVVRAWAADSLGHIGDSRTLPHLIGLLSRQHWQVRVTAARALAKIGDPAASEPLKKARKQESLRRRRHFTKALLRLRMHRRQWQNRQEQSA
jgi:HEAT repeat protein